MKNVFKEERRRTTSKCVNQEDTGNKNTCLYLKKIAFMFCLVVVWFYF